MQVYSCLRGFFSFFFSFVTANVSAYFILYSKFLFYTLSEGKMESLPRSVLIRILNGGQSPFRGLGNENLLFGDVGTYL